MSVKKIYFCGIVLLIVGFIVMGIPFYHFTNDTTKPLNEAAFPQQIQGLTRKQVISGPQAIAMISKLHGSDISIKQGYIATYAGNNGQIMIWVSESASSAEAIKLFQVMDQKISRPASSSMSGGPPFTNRRVLKVKGRSVVRVQGMGMQNYYYQIENRVYWIALGGVDPSRTLAEAMEKL